MSPDRLPRHDCQLPRRAVARGLLKLARKCATNERGELWHRSWLLSGRGDKPCNLAARVFCIVRDDRAFAVSLLDDGNVRSLRGLRRGWTPGSDVRCRSAIKNHTAPCGPRQLGLE